jgi:hypothetical protein
MAQKVFAGAKGGQTLRKRRASAAEKKLLFFTNGYLNMEDTAVAAPVSSPIFCVYDINEFKYEELAELCRAYIKSQAEMCEQLISAMEDKNTGAWQPIVIEYVHRTVAKILVRRKRGKSWIAPASVWIPPIPPIYFQLYLRDILITLAFPACTGTFLTLFAVPVLSFQMLIDADPRLGALLRAYPRQIIRLFEYSIMGLQDRFMQHNPDQDRPLYKKHKIRVRIDRIPYTVEMQKSTSECHFSRSGRLRT